MSNLYQVILAPSFCIGLHAWLGLRVIQSFSLLNYTTYTYQHRLLSLISIITSDLDQGVGSMIWYLSYYMDCIDVFYRVWYISNIVSNPRQSRSIQSTHLLALVPWAVGFSNIYCPSVHMCMYVWVGIRYVCTPTDPWIISSIEGFSLFCIVYWVLNGWVGMYRMDHIEPGGTLDPDP